MTKLIYVLSSIMLIISLVSFVFISLPSAKSVFKPAKQILPIEKEAIDLSCREGLDCQIKDVGNQCGYYPMCVNKKFIPKPPELNSIICGFPSIKECQCLNNQCQGF